MGRRSTITRLEDHPNLGEILGVLAQLAHISDDQLARLAAAWRNTTSVANARRRALSPDSPLVVEVLAAFDALAALYADDLNGEADYLTVDPGVASTGLKAVRDAMAAAYARPILSRGEYNALISAWRQVFPRPTVAEPDLGPAASHVKRLLAALGGLSGRCHDVEARRVFDGLAVTAMTQDEDEHAAAVSSAWTAAVLTGRRRLWALVRRTGAESFGRMCMRCRTAREPVDEQRVLSLALDAACALLVADALDDATTTRLTEPISALVPLPRQSVDD